MKPTLIAGLAEYASTLRFEELPEEVVEKAKICLLDTLGVAVGGYDAEAVRVAVRTTKLLGAPGPTTIWVDGHKGRAIDCVLANSVMAHSILQDDWDPVSHAHVGVAVVPTAIAVAEEGGQSGRDLLLATVVGYEIEGRCGVVSVPTFTRGFRASSVYSRFGAAATAAKLMRLPAEQFKNAIACAGGVTGGVLQPWIDGSMEWAYQEGFGSRDGILAALLAREGLQGADNILEGPRGVNHCFAGTFEGQEETLRDLGSRFLILDTCFKRFPTGGANQGSMAVAWDLAQQHRIDYRRIRAVRVQIPHTGTHERMNYAGITYQGPFHTVDQCLISKPFGIATILKNGDMDIDVVRREQSNPEITELAHKIHLEEVKGMTGWALSMDVELDDNTVLHGDGSNIDQSHIYLDRERAARKFLAMSSQILGAARAEQIVELVLGLEKLDGVAPIVERLIPA